MRRRLRTATTRGIVTIHLVDSSNRRGKCTASPARPVRGCKRRDTASTRATRRLDFQLLKPQSRLGERMERIGVVGAGLMGAEIALVYALSGHEVLLADTGETLLADAL